MIPIMNLYNFLLSMFGRTAKNGSQQSSYTPPRAQSRAGTAKAHKISNVPDRVREYPQRLPSRLPKSFPLIRNPSQIQLLGSTTNKGGAVNAAFDARRKDSVIDLRAVPFNRRSSSAFDLDSASEDSLYMSPNDFEQLEKDLTVRKTRPGKNTHSFTGTRRNRSGSNLRNTDAPFRRFSSVPDNRKLLESCPPVTALSQASLLGSKKYTPQKTKGIARERGSNTILQNLLLENSLDYNILENTNTRREVSSRGFTAQKGSRSSVEFHSAAGTQLNEPSGREAFTTKQLRLRSNPHSVPETLPSKRLCSKIPIRKEERRIKEFSKKTSGFMNFPEHHRGKYTLSSTKKFKYPVPGYQEKGDTIDAAHLKFDGINSWIAFRNVTNERFECVFKSLSKMKHHSTGNIIDANSHVYWMGIAGIAADKDASMFRSFAGGKVVLTLAEYKFLLHKICIAYDLDYWDVLRKMATFQGEEFYDEEQTFLV